MQVAYYIQQQGRIQRISLKEGSTSECRGWVGLGDGPEVLHGVRGQSPCMVKARENLSEKRVLGGAPEAEQFFSFSTFLTDVHVNNSVFSPM